MFKYLHPYHPDSWEGQVKCGLIDRHAGVRLVQGNFTEDAFGFNRLAAKGGKFYQVVKELNGPMYVDRLQGGLPIYDYTYDTELIEEYNNLLGDNFYGFQFHEWASNLRSDLTHIGSDPGCDWTVEGIKKVIYKLFPYPDLQLEAQTAEETAQMGPIRTAEEFYQAIVSLLERRSGKFRLVPCDSGALAYKLELEHGIRTFMPEVGAQTADARLQISYARSMAKAYGARFGVYYEPWGGKPFSTCFCQRDSICEWGGLTNDNFPYKSAGENGGSSRSLQKRIHLYSYLSGAEFISEEWGGSNTFYNFVDFELTPYGIEKKKFLSFVNKYPKIGEKMAPIALVLPKDYTVVYGIHAGATFADYPVLGEKGEKLVRIKEAICDVFSKPVSDMTGDEIGVLINSDIPDAVDMIHEDSKTLGEYEYLIDATQNPAFAKEHSNVCAIEDLPCIFEKTLPCKVEGGLHWMVNKCEDKYYLAIFNHSGISRSVAEGEKVIPGSEKTVKVTLKPGRYLKALEGAEISNAENGVYHIKISGGDWFFGEF